MKKRIFFYFLFLILINNSFCKDYVVYSNGTILEINNTINNTNNINNTINNTNNITENYVFNKQIDNFYKKIFIKYYTIKKKIIIKINTIILNFKLHFNKI